jgi:S-adenosyl-L-methionine hydrolase (adenosine-forming)
MKRSGIITFLTDFGTRDHFVGVMKGVIAGIAPRVRVVDISHDGPAFGLRAARFLLSQSWPWFPKGTVHLAVVDPGVGTARRALVVEAAGHLFVGPDNGLLSDLLALKGVKVRQVTSTKYCLKDISQTFHGRDVFAPLAAYLAAGIETPRVGPLVKDALVVTTDGPRQTGKRHWQGEVAYVDRYGNLITNLPASQFPDLRTRGCALRIGFETLVGLKENYAAGAPDEPVIVIGSSGNLEVALNQGDAARKLGVSFGSPVELEVR